jgi:hypothetical protein
MICATSFADSVRRLPDQVSRSRDAWGVRAGGKVARRNQITTGFLRYSCFQVIFSAGLNWLIMSNGSESVFVSSAVCDFYRGGTKPLVEAALNPLI